MSDEAKLRVVNAVKEALSATPSADCEKRLKKDYVQVQRLMAEGDTEGTRFCAVPDERSLLYWHFVLFGPENTPYEGGMYYGNIVFPPDFPLRPPKFVMRTPSGRFVPDVSICTTFTDFHPETWSPMWTVTTMLDGFLSFLVEDGVTAGGILQSRAEREELALKSIEFNMNNPEFVRAFPEFALDDDD